MEIVVVHGYFLKGTGSNLFVANLCREFCKMGHHVNLFCQEDSPEDFDFIKEAFDFDNENKKKIKVYNKETHYSGKCSLYKPNLNGFLPVFVYDEYPKYEVKTFINCTKEEIEKYLEDNQKAIDTALEGKKTEMIISNHTIMQPVYAQRSCLGRESAPHVMIVHGSCLNFAVRKSLLIKEYAKMIIEKVTYISFVSDYSRNEFLEFFNNQKEIEEKTKVIFGGVDLRKFKALKIDDKKNQVINELVEELIKGEIKNKTENKEVLWKTDNDIIEKLKNIDFEKEKVILYYGKYLWTKGIQILIAAAPIILKKHKNIRFVFVGFGSSRGYFEALIQALHKGERKKFLDLIQAPENLDKEIDPQSRKFFKALIKKLEEPIFAEEYFNEAKEKIGSAIIFTGFLGHDHLKSLIACSEITVAPSIFPEAFGLVAVEALASGIIPIQTNHSGFEEVIKIYVNEFSDIFNKQKLYPLYLDENLVLNMANNISVFLDYYNQMTDEEREIIRERARSISFKYFSWESVANKYINL